MRFHSHLRGRLTSLGALTIGVLTIVCPSDASAHVKWFAPFNVASEPRSPLSVLSPTFGYLFLISLVVMFGTAVVERTPFGAALLDTLDRIGGVFRSRTEALLRACAGAFLVALFVLGNVILTPELKTQSVIIPWLQVVMAIGLFWRPTMVLTGFGIVALYAIGVANYGVFHLLSNAVKFTQAGGHVRISASMLHSGEPIIVVSDTGIGMRPEDVKLALEPFRQIDGALNRRYEGTGLGLPLVQRLVQLHGGSLSIKTAPGAGTTITLRLPADRCIREVA